MPDRLAPRPALPPEERLDRAIERLRAGRPAPVLDDPELQELVELAAMLYDELPRDLPDPAFRAQLKDDLLHRRLAADPRRQPARVPYLPALVAMAAAFLAALVVGTLAVWQGGGDENGESNIAIATALESATAGLLAVTSTSTTDSGVVALSTETSGQPSDQTRVATIETAAATTTPAPIPTPATTPTPTRATATVLLASLPPVDRDHLETGPAPAADGGGEPPSPDLVTVLDTSLPDLGATAPVLWLAPPSVEPEQFVMRVARALELSGDVTWGESATGETQYHVGSPEDGSFHWTPVSGTFSYQGSLDLGGAPVDAEEAGRLAREWLARMGYPIAQLDLAADVEPWVDGSSWQVQARFDDAPQPGLGHALGATVIVTGDGVVTEAWGFWLEVVGREEAPLVSAEEAWESVKRGEGYWTGGGAVAGGGEFRCRELRVTWLLTRADDGRLALQPVVQARGELRSPDGQSTAQISAFVPAVRADAP